MQESSVIAVPLPSNLKVNTTSNNTNATDGCILCEKETLVVIILSAVFGALLGLLFVASFCAITSSTRRVRRRNVRLAGSVRRVDPQPARRVALPGVLHVHPNMCYGTSPLLERNGDSSLYSSPFDVSLNPAYCSTSTFRTQPPSSEPASQHDDVFYFPSRDDREGLSGPRYDRLQPKDGDTLSDSPNYENTTAKLLLHDKHKEYWTPQGLFPASSTTSPPQAAGATQTGATWAGSTSLAQFGSSDLVLAGTTLTPPMRNVRLSTLSEGYVNELDGPPLASPRVEPDSTQVPLSEHCKCAATYSIPQHNEPRDYETPVLNKKIRKGLITKILTMKW